ncbi:MAG: hypothetical protein WCW33_06215 [Candidatus Babeliales bacterium]|jgi:hypothetical protein
MLKPLKYCCLLVSFVVAGALGAQQPASVVSKNASEKMAQEMLIKFAQGKNDPSAVSKAFTTIIETCKEPSIDIAQLLPCAIFVYLLATIVHEYGHVGALNAFCKVEKPTEVYIGRARRQPLFSIGHLHFMNFPWIMGEVSNEKLLVVPSCGGAGNNAGQRYDEVNNYRIRPGLESYNGLCEGIGRSAGGASAAALLYTCIALVCKYCTYVDGKPFPKITLKNVITGFSPFQTIVQTKALSLAHKRVLLNLTFVMCTALFFQMTYGVHEVIANEKNANIGKFLRWTFTAACDCVLFKKYYDARTQLLCPNPVS